MLICLYLCQSSWHVCHNQPCFKSEMYPSLSYYVWKENVWSKLFYNGSIPNTFVNVSYFATIRYDEWSVTSHFNCIVARWLSHGMCLYQVIMTLHFLNDVINDIESTHLSINTSISQVWTVNQLYRIPGSCLLISSLPGRALITHIESLCKPRNVKKHSQSLAW